MVSSQEADTLTRYSSKLKYQKPRLAEKLMQLKFRSDLNNKKKSRSGKANVG